MSFIKLSIASLLLVFTVACESVDIGNNTSEVVFVPEDAEDDGRIQVRAKRADPALSGGNGGVIVVTTEQSNPSPPIMPVAAPIINFGGVLEGVRDKERLEIDGFGNVNHGGRTRTKAGVELNNDYEAFTAVSVSDNANVTDTEQRNKVQVEEAYDEEPRAVVRDSAGNFAVIRARTHIGVYPSSISTVTGRR